MLSNSIIKQRFEDSGIETTDNPFDAIYVLRDGTLISGMFYDGVNRTEDHRCVECLFDDIDRYTPHFWDRVLKRTGMVMLIPEIQQALISPYIQPTLAQQKVLNELNYEITV